VAPPFVLLGSERAMDIVKTSPVPKSSLVSTYSFLTIMDCAIQERFQGSRGQSLLATALIEAPKIQPTSCDVIAPRSVKINQLF
jgi:hypothetical protein